MQKGGNGSMPITDDAPAFERQGFLKEDFRLFHLKDKVSPCYEFHYHDFLKIMVLLEGKVNYVIAVSYTHLDGYKRQTQGRTPQCGCPR